jgi:hypothetical protein
MIEVLLDALLDTAKMIPLLLIIYIGIELVEYRFGNLIRKKVQKAGKAGPLLGAVAGTFPQCGFSVVTAALYSQRLVTIGTFLAVLLSTSDEALPVILSQPDKLHLIWPLLITKVIIALVAGYMVDFIFRKSNQKTLAHINSYAHGLDDQGHHHESVIEEPACCGHSTSSEAKKFNYHEIIWHPVKHTAKIISFIFLATLGINLLMLYIGEAKLAALFLGHTFWQPVVAALVGLIPNCAASVTITQLYLQDTISYGATIAGLSASGGLGILVLFKEDKNKKDIFKVISLLFVISVLSGLIIQYLF